jgi:L-amino acid N-acyltransferase YncA
MHVGTKEGDTVMEYTVEAMKPDDWAQVSAIYLEGIQTKIATFQETLPSWESWDRAHAQECRVVAREGGTVLGWAAISPVSDRCVYAGVGMVSVYVGRQHRGRGVGTALMTELVRLSEANGYWTLESRIIGENTASLSLHAGCGFRTVGVREKLGKMDTGKWHDVVLVERRSARVGID